MRIPLLQSEGRTSSFEQNIELLRYFTRQIELLANPGVLDLLRTCAAASFTNRDARAFMGLKRSATWLRLSSMVELGMLEKRGQSYKVSPLSKELVSALASAYRSVISGRAVIANKPQALEVLRIAKQGIDVMYVKGVIQQAERSGYERILADFEKEVGI